MSDSNCSSEPVFYAAVEEACTCGPVIKVFDDSDKVGVDVVLFHGCPQTYMYMQDSTNRDQNAMDVGWYDVG